MGVLLDSMRVPYIHRVLTTTLHHRPDELSVLDVGCGGGSLTVLLGRLGYRMSAVEPDPVALEAAQQRARDEAVTVQFEAAAAERLPFPAATFDVVVCSEVLEHVDCLEKALDEIYRVLKFSGVLIFSTPNRTVLSHLLLIKLAQDWRPTRVLRSVHHRLEDLIQPRELEAELERRGIDVYEITGVSSPISALPGIVGSYASFKLGRSPLAQVAGSMRLRAGGGTAIAYIGWGVKFG